MSISSSISDFCSKNRSLVIFLVITVIAAAVLAFLDIQSCQRINESIENIRAAGDEITKINDVGQKAPGDFVIKEGWDEKKIAEEQEKWEKRRRDTRIVSGNAHLIKEDVHALEKKIAQTQSVYGNFTGIAFDAFLTFMATVPENDKDNPTAEKIAQAFSQMSPLTFQAELKKAINEVSKSRDDDMDFQVSVQKKIFSKMWDNLSKKVHGVDPTDVKAKMNEAFKVFCAETDKLSIEKVSREDSYASGESLFFQALGLQRSMRNDEFPKYREDFIKWARQKYDLDKEAEGRFLSPAKLNMIAKNVEGGNDSSFRDTDATVGERLPPPDNVKHLMLHLQVYDNLFRLMHEAGIASLVSLSPDRTRSGGLLGQVNGEYRTYSYNVKVIGSLTQLRKMLNAMHHAYKEHRVYCITNFMMKSYYPQGANQDGTTVKELDEVKKYVMTLKPREVAANAGKEKAEQDKKAQPQTAVQVDVTADPLYGAARVGISDMVEAEFNLDYILYVADSLNMKKSK